MSGEEYDLFSAPPPTPPSIDDLRAEARLAISRCPCCGGQTKLYRRKLNATMAATVVTIGRIADAGAWVHVHNELPRDLVNGARQISILTHWLLVERQGNDDPTKRTSGCWRLTEEGRAFANRELEVPSHAFIRAPGDVFLGFEDTFVDVIEALGRRFNYAELLAGTGR